MRRPRHRGMPRFQRSPSESFGVLDSFQDAAIPSGSFRFRFQDLFESFRFPRLPSRRYYGQANAAFREAIALLPSMGSAYESLAELRLLRLRHEEAFEVAKAALHLHPQAPSPETFSEAMEAAMAAPPGSRAQVSAIRSPLHSESPTFGVPYTRSPLRAHLFSATLLATQSPPDPLQCHPARHPIPS